jgi:hypothetical protein
LVTAEAITREPRGDWKSGTSPAIPVSITATPTPWPVARYQARSARIERRNGCSRRLIALVTLGS